MSKHTGGGKFGKVRNSWPFVTLAIETDGISIRTIFQEVRIKRKFIQTIIKQRNVLNHRFIFNHTDPTIQREIEFWTFSPGSVANDLLSKGYPVSEAK